MRRVTITFPWPLTAVETRGMLSYIFQVSLASLVGFSLAETISPGFVSNYIQLNVFLWVTIVFGAMTVVWPFLATQKQGRSWPTWRRWLVAACLAIGAGWIVWSKAQSLGLASKSVAPLSGLIVAGLAILLYFEGDEPDSTAEPDDQP